MIGKYIFWLIKNARMKYWHCKGFCPTCPYYKHCNYEYRYLNGKKGR